ncbi:MAG: phosphorylase [Acidobacteriaceae bacterium]|nr:phosphorylase [Acidobacteriaceae bacterium]
MPELCKVAIVAALEREVWPLIKNWPTTHKQFDGREFKFFENDSVVVVCGGIGPEAARRASEAIIRLHHPVLIISAGFAGAVDPALQVGHTFIARQVIDADDGSRTDCDVGASVLVSFGDVADVQQKAKLGTAYGAHAVDMEAAAVARSAEAHGVNFLACKVISDTSRTTLPPIARFIGSDGRFQALGFLAYVGIRPWLWANVRRLASNSALAARKLCVILAETAEVHAADRVLTR